MTRERPPTDPQTCSYRPANAHAQTRKRPSTDPRSSTHRPANARPSTRERPRTHPSTPSHSFPALSTLPIGQVDLHMLFVFLLARRKLVLICYSSIWNGFQTNSETFLNRPVEGPRTLRQPCRNERATFPNGHKKYTNSTSYFRLSLDRREAPTSPRAKAPYFLYK